MDGCLATKVEQKSFYLWVNHSWNSTIDFRKSFLSMLDSKKTPVNHANGYPFYREGKIGLLYFFVLLGTAWVLLYFWSPEVHVFPLARSSRSDGTAGRSATAKFDSPSYRLRWCLQTPCTSVCCTLCVSPWLRWEWRYDESLTDLVWSPLVCRVVVDQGLFVLGLQKDALRSPEVLYYPQIRHSIESVINESEKPHISSLHSSLSANDIRRLADVIT